MFLHQLDEDHRTVSQTNESHKKRIKAQYDQEVHPRVFSKGDMVLVYDQYHDKLGEGKFKLTWYGPLIFK